MINRQEKNSFFGVYFCILFFISSVSYAQFESHPSEDWFTIETQNFTVSYHTGAQRTAQTISKIAEEIYGPITDLYNFKPKEKVNFVVNDLSDIANGATDYYGNRIEIFASALDFELRGTHNWLRNVITHEFTHMVQIQSSLKFTKNIPAFYLQWINYEKERRPDVLYGYPNIIVSYPISGVGVPAWFAEGVAQYQRQQMGYDYWDANRDMILRSYALDNNMLTWNEMGQFSSITSLKAESIYNSGFALTRYIASKYGEDKLKLVTQSLGDLTNFSIDKSFRKNLGIDGKDLYNEWKAFLQKDYKERIAPVKNSLIEGDIIGKIGFANYYPRFSPDGKKIACLSNGDYDYGATALIVYDIATKKIDIISTAVSYNFAWSNDGKKIIYSKRNSPPSIEETVIYDIYEYDFAAKDEKRLTENLRAFSPSYSPDGSKVIFVSGSDGTLNLFLANKDLSGKKMLTGFRNGEQVYNPVFTPDGKNIIFDYSYRESRKIAKLDIESGNFEFLINKENIDTRNPRISKDGKKMFYCSNETGIFNVYTYDFETKKIKQVTNVIGGAFMPDIDGNNNIVYSTYQSTGFKISLLKNLSEREISELGAYNPPEKLISKYTVSDSTDTSNEKRDWNYLKKFNDDNVDNKPGKPYTSIFNQLSIFPLLRFDNYSKNNNFLDAIKPGLYFFSDELMTRFSIFGGAAINRKAERDLFLQFTYDNGMPVAQKYFAKHLNFDPKFTLSGYNVTRKTDALLYAGVDTLSVGVAYDLLEFELAMDFKLINYNHNFRVAYGISKYASSVDDFVLPQSGVDVRSSSQNYFKANRLTLEYKYDRIYPSRNMDINSVGRKVDILYEYEVSNINPELTVDDKGNVSTNYAKNKLHKLDVNWFEALPLFSNTSVSLKLRGAAIFGKTVDSFYDFYAGGLIGMRGYPFFSLGGGRLASAKLEYRFPLINKIDTRISPFYLDKLYFSVFGDFGNAWYGSSTSINDFKKDIGAELRLQAFSSYVFPTSVFFSTAYGTDRFTKRFSGKDVTYGKEWIFYAGILFGFDL
ncbi:MAG: biopolymer transporter Tol [Ignavibacteria bacterium]|nr:biopolymer transporter Tol [Ignavibacteria bacterium]